MMKVVKKITNIIFCLTILFTFFVLPTDVSAKSIADYRKDLEALKQEKKDIAAGKEQTQADINRTNAEIESIKQQIEKATKEQEDKEREIAELEIEIKQKEEQIKELVAFLQISQGENFYLKYVFGAETFTDFIYRISVVEQLTERNDELVEEMNILIEENKKKIIELEAKKAELAKLNQEMLKKVSSLSKLKNYIAEAVDIDAQIGSVQELITFYTKEGCSETQDLSKCATSVPYDNGFSKPLKTGRVTSEFGQRYHPTQKRWKLHSGIDLGGNSEGTPVLAPASGKVVALYYRRSCGGNQIIINHIVNGKYYTTQYMHLLTMKVKVGDIVTKGQTIGTVGGGRGTSSYETCSTGAHLHFMMASGHYLGNGLNSYSSYNTYISRLYNPRDIIYFPNIGKYW